MMRTLLIFVLLLLIAPVTAAGTIDSFPDGEKFHRTFLSQARGLLQEEARGPLDTRVLRYRDVFNGEKRTFLWTAQKFENPDGHKSYIIVFTQLFPGGRQEILTSGGFSSLEMDYSDELEPAYGTVYDQFNQHIRASRLRETF
jgi:hypothetical protein